MPAEQNMYGFHNPILDANIIAQNFERNCSIKLNTPSYSTLPNRKPQYEQFPERSVTPDIMRGLHSKQFNSMDRRYIKREHFNNEPLHQNLGIPVQMPQIYKKDNSPLRPKSAADSSFKISPINPMNSGGFHSSTPSKVPDLRAAINLEHKLLSPKKSTMSNEELYAVIHKSKKKMNIQASDTDRGSPALSNNSLSPVSSEGSLCSKNVKPESGYLVKSKSRLSWSPNNGEYVDFSTNIDKVPLERSTRQSWACSDKKESQTSRLDFKRLLLMHGKNKLPSKKLSAVEQLKLTKQSKPTPTSSEVSILDLTSSPKNLRNRKVVNPNSPSRTPEKQRPIPKLLSPRSQWRFANPRSDVLSSTILEDCHEDESPNTSGERKSPPGAVRSMKQMFENEGTMTATQRLQAQRAQFFNPTTIQSKNEAQTDNKGKPTLETAF